MDLINSPAERVTVIPHDQRDYESTINCSICTFDAYLHSTWNVWQCNRVNCAQKFIWSTLFCLLILEFLPTYSALLALICTLIAQPFPINCHVKTYNALFAL